MKTLSIALVVLICGVGLVYWLLSSQDEQIYFIKQKIIPKNTPVAAIILDDVGLSLEAAERLIALPYPLTFSIIPRTPYACQISEDAWSSDKEVMLHMPMQADDRKLTASYNVKLVLPMTPRQIAEQLSSALEEVRFASGVNNHMGSSFTRNKEAMTVVFKYLAARKLYFIDSRTNRKNTTQKLAHEYDVQYAQRDIFLDANPDPQMIRQQFYKLIELAKKNGKAVAIGHITRPNTVAVLEEMLPKIEESGVKLVFASELVK